MSHLKSVEEISDGISLWTANTPEGVIDLKWKSEITREEPGEYLGWQSICRAGILKMPALLHAMGIPA